MRMIGALLPVTRLISRALIEGGMECHTRSRRQLAFCGTVPPGQSRYDHGQAHHGLITAIAVYGAAP